MTSLLYKTIEQISKEKGINPDVIVGAVEDAVLTATKKYYRTEEDLRARLNRETGQVDVFSLKRVADPVLDPANEISLKEARRIDPKAEVAAEIEIHKPTDVLGRIAAQTAKQVIFQKVREAERDNILSEFGNRTGDMVTGLVKRAENGDLVIDLGKTEAVLPRREQSRAESFSPGDRIRVVIVRVLRTARGPQVVVSRTDPAILSKLFEMEVPEIYEGTVVVKNAVREPGDRAKVAVHSKEKDVDPVGACVGIKGQRVQGIIRELRGEKIDIVEWSDDPKTFAINALNPAKVSRVSIVDEKEKIMEVIVEDKQLSLAIGKKGQNVRLAARLIGWRIDIKSEDEKKREVESQMDRMGGGAAYTDIREVLGIGDKTLEKLVNHGFASVEEIAALPPETLTEVPGVGLKTAEKVVALARAHLARETAPDATADGAEGAPSTEALAATMDGDAEGDSPEPISDGDSPEPICDGGGAPSHRGKEAPSHSGNDRGDARTEEDSEREPVPSDGSGGEP